MACCFASYNCCGASDRTRYYGNGGDFCCWCFSLFNFLGNLLLNLINFSLVKGIYAIAPIHLGYANQTNSYCTEIPRRIILFLIFLIFLIPGTILAIPGLLFKMVASLGRGDFTFSYPEIERSEVKTQGAGEIILSVVTFNLAHYPEVVAAWNGLPPPFERAQRLVVLVKSLFRGADFLCFQENFNEECVAVLRNGLADVWPYRISGVGYPFLGLNSGLFIASKHPLRNPVFMPHAQIGCWDRVANKGVLGVTALLPDGQRQAIFTTHLNGGTVCGPSGNWYDRQQILSYDAFVRRYVANYGVPNMGWWLQGIITPVLMILLPGRLTLTGSKQSIIIGLLPRNYRKARFMIAVPLE